MRFYIASSFQNKDMVRYVAQKLILKGFNHTYDWTKNQRAVVPDTLRELGELEINAVHQCDVLVLLLPAGKSSHVELGIALGLGKLIYIYSPDEIDLSTASTFYYVEGVTRFSGNLEDFITIIGIA
ncbi:nucleoside 2-deoxyribosyltransferase [Virgibacillus sp. DJP39]|uniref:nucleoside 2-deoxyribosyltransferase n=1 Tax=Virgibacillus sp. DJP39 TaxID=3409790 RepID=UPI003BB6C611